MTQTMFLLWIPVAHHPMDDTQANIAARYDWGYLSNNDPLNPDGSVNYGPYITLSDRLRILNPNHKTGWFAGGIGAQRPIEITPGDRRLQATGGMEWPRTAPTPGTESQWQAGTLEAVGSLPATAPGLGGMPQA